MSATNTGSEVAQTTQKHVCTTKLQHDLTLNYAPHSHLCLPGLCRGQALHSLRKVLPPPASGCIRSRTSTQACKACLSRL